jgi:hypothetical protein
VNPAPLAARFSKVAGQVPILIFPASGYDRRSFPIPEAS